MASTPKGYDKAPKYVTINGKKVNLVQTDLQVKNTGLKGTMDSNGSLINQQYIFKTNDPKDTNYYVWIGNGGVADEHGNTGRYLTIPKAQINNTALKTDFYNKVDIKTIGTESDPLNYFNSKFEYQNKQANTVKANKAPSYTAPKAPSNDKEVQALKDEITKYREEIKELTRVWSADEAAEYLGITNDKQKWLDEMNDRTNDYYDAAVAEQQALRNDYVRNNANYINMLTDAYIDSTKYVAPTATNRGIQAANLMNTSMSADTTNSSNDYGMQQNIQNFEAQRKAELENNPYLAEQEYNNIKTMLSNWSANKNTSDIKQYIDRLDAYTNYYAADRAYQAYLSQANAAKYSGLANVSQNKAQAIANAYGSNVNKYANMYELFKAGYGSDYAASNQLTHLWDQSSKANQ